MAMTTDVSGEDKIIWICGPKTFYVLTMPHSHHVIDGLYKQYKTWKETSQHENEYTTLDELHGQVILV